MTAFTVSHDEAGRTRYKPTPELEAVLKQPRITEADLRVFYPTKTQVFEEFLNKRGFVREFEEDIDVMGSKTRRVWVRKKTLAEMAVLMAFAASDAPAIKEVKFVVSDEVSEEDLYGGAFYNQSLGEPWDKNASGTELINLFHNLRIDHVSKSARDPDVLWIHGADWKKLLEQAKGPASPPGLAQGLYYDTSGEYRFCGCKVRFLAQPTEMFVGCASEVLLESRDGTANRVLGVKFKDGRQMGCHEIQFITTQGPSFVPKPLGPKAVKKKKKAKVAKAKPKAGPPPKRITPASLLPGRRLAL